MCRSLDQELDTLRRIDSHWTDEEITRRETDHARHCPVCTGWAPPPNKPRDPGQETP